MSNEPTETHDPDVTAHPNPDVYETCENCDYEYKLIDAECANCNGNVVIMD